MRWRSLGRRPADALFTIAALGIGGAVVAALLVSSVLTAPSHRACQRPFWKWRDAIAPATCSAAVARLRRRRDRRGGAGRWTARCRSSDGVSTSSRAIAPAWSPSLRAWWKASWWSTSTAGCSTSMTPPGDAAHGPRCTQSHVCRSHSPPGHRLRDQSGARRTANARFGIFADSRRQPHSSSRVLPRSFRPAAARCSCCTTSPICGAPTRFAATSSPTSRTSYARR